MAASALIVGAGAVMYIFIAVSVPSTEVRPGGPAVKDAPLAKRLTGPVSARSRLILTAASALVVAGIILTLTLIDVVTWGTLIAAVLILTGGAVAWSTSSTPTSVNGQILRLAAGVVLMVMGVLTFVVRDESLSVIGFSVGLGLLVLAVALLALWPAAQRLVTTVKEAQEERIRETERADLAAHLHDSVLQTLTLIRTKANSPEEVTRLARVQERQLRTWLYTDRSVPGASLADAIKRVAAEVEDLHGTPIECVVVGDMKPSVEATALVAATREAMTNAVLHGQPPVALYMEITPRDIDVYVRDHGSGLSVDAIPADRHGIRESIVARLKRVGGNAVFGRREPGTEVHLTLPQKSEVHHD